MNKFKRRLSLSLQGSQTIDESLSELAEQMTIEENSSKDNEPIVKNGRPPTSHSMHSFLHQYTWSFRKPLFRDHIALLEEALVPSWQCPEMEAD